MGTENIHIDGFMGAAHTDIGGRSENQDSYRWGATPLGLLVTVCDGMGGGPAGKTASSIAADTILDTLGQCHVGDDASEAVVEAIRKANLKVYEKACSQPELQGMGTTCTVLLLGESAAIAAYVGDSRIYQLRGHKKLFRTFDHSMVFELVKQGIITEEQARQSAQSNVITRALGLSTDVEVDVQTLHYHRGDRFMLSSDGIHGVIPEKELLKDITAKGDTLEHIVDQLTDKVKAIGQSNGGSHDNMTIVLIEAQSEKKEKTFAKHMKQLFKRWFLLAAMFVSGMTAMAQVASGYQLLPPTIVWQVEPKYQYVKPMGYYYWLLKDGDGRSTMKSLLVNKNAAELLDSITPIYGNYALGLKKSGTRWQIVSVINRTICKSEPVTSICYAPAKVMVSGSMIGFVDEDGKSYGFIDERGTVVVKAKYQEIFPFVNGVAKVVLPNGKDQYVNTFGKVVGANAASASAPWDQELTETVQHTQNTEFRVARGDNGLFYHNEVLPITIVDADGTKQEEKEMFFPVTPPQFEDLSLFYKGNYAAAKINGKYGILKRENSETVRGELYPDEGKPIFIARLGKNVDTDQVDVKLIRADGRQIPMEPTLAGGDSIVYSIPSAMLAENFGMLLSYKELQQSLTKYEKPVAVVEEKVQEQPVPNHPVAENNVVSELVKNGGNANPTDHSAEVKPGDTPKKDEKKQVEQPAPKPQQDTSKPKPAPTPAADSNLTLGSLTVKRNGKADVDDKVYFNVEVKNSGSATQKGTVTLFVGDKSYPSKPLQVAANATTTVTITVPKVTEERYVKVYAKLSNGKTSPVKQVQLKPFY